MLRIFVTIYADNSLHYALSILHIVLYRKSKPYFEVLNCILTQVNIKIFSVLHKKVLTMGNTHVII